MQDDYSRLSGLAESFIDGVLERIPDCRLNGSRERRIPTTVNISFDGIEGESIVLGLDLKGVAVASGSACTSGATEPSHVLQAMKVPTVSARGAVRFSLGRSTTKEDLEYVLTELGPIIQRLREMSPMYSKSK
jgi:cysteine desulfurase